MLSLSQEGVFSSTQPRDMSVSAALEELDQTNFGEADLNDVVGTQKSHRPHHSTRLRGSSNLLKMDKPMSLRARLNCTSCQRPPSLRELRACLGDVLRSSLAIPSILRRYCRPLHETPASRRCKSICAWYLTVQTSCRVSASKCPVDSQFAIWQDDRSC